MSNVTVLRSTNNETITYEDLKIYYELNEQIKDLTKTMEKYKDKIKSIMILNDLDTVTAGEYVTTLTNRVTKKVDDDMLSSVLIANDLSYATELKIVPIKDQVILAIKEGKLNQVQYDLCTKSSVSQAIQVKKKA